MRFVLLAALAACTTPGAAMTPDAGTNPTPDAPIAVDAQLVADATPDAPPDAPVVWSPTPTTQYVDPTGKHPTVTLHLPAGYATSVDQARPLFLFLHGYGSGSSYAGWFPIEAKDVVWVAPLGSVDSHGAHFWNASAACCDRDLTGIDDAAYLGGLLDRILAEVHIDRSMVVVVGASNGGFMAERLACDRSDVITETVDLAGATRDVYDDRPCAPTKKVAMLVDHSEGDHAVWFNGGSIYSLRPFPPVLGMQSTTDRGHCTALASTATGIDHDSAIAGADTDQSDADCDRGHLTYWHEASSIHVFAPTAAWSDDVWAWLVAHRRSS